jgi:hypothetical protein
MRRDELEIALQKVEKDRDGAEGEADDDCDSQSSCSTDRDIDFESNRASTWRDEAPLGEGSGLTWGQQSSNRSNEGGCAVTTSAATCPAEQDACMSMTEFLDSAIAARPFGSRRSSQSQSVSLPKLDSIQDEDAVEDSEVGSDVADKSGKRLSPEDTAEQNKSQSQCGSAKDCASPYRRGFLSYLLPKVVKTSSVVPAQRSSVLPTEFTQKEHRSKPRRLDRLLQKITRRGSRETAIDCSAAGG